MLKSMLTLCCCVALTACGSDNKGTAADASAEGTGATPLSALALNSSKMAQQATVSSQAQADQSETASSGSDDGSGTSKRAEPHKGGGELGIRPQPGIDFNQPLAIDFNVALDFNAYVGPDHSTANGSVQASVRRGGPGNSNSSITLAGSIEETDDRGHRVRQSTEPNITIDKQGSRADGKVVRNLRGIVRRTLQADNSNVSFDYLINHTDTLVVDLYANSTLTSRAISGTATINDAASGDSAVLTFTNLIRSAPSVCLCPTGGTISAAYTHAGATKTISHSFSGTCGEVTVEESLAVSGTAGVGAKATDSTASSTSSAEQGAATPSDGTSVSSGVQTSVSAKVIWANCIPG